MSTPDYARHLRSLIDAAPPVPPLDEPPDTVRVVVFSYTSKAERVGSAAFEADVAWMDREIAAAELAADVGQTPRFEERGRNKRPV